MAYKPIPDPAPPLTPEQKRKNALTLIKQEKAKKEAKPVVYPKDVPVDEPISKPFAKGGSVRGGGCEKRGKTKGKMV